MGIASVKFRGRHSSVIAIAFMIAGFLALVLLPVMQFMTSARGAAPYWMGYVGLGAMLMSIIGFAAGIKTMGERDVYMWQPLAALAINGLSIVIWIIVFTVGAVRAEGLL